MTTPRRPAFGIIETLLASLTIAFMVLGLYTISMAISRSSRVALERSMAASLNEEAIEMLRYKRAIYWADASPADGLLPGLPVPPRAVSLSADGLWSYLQKMGDTIGAPTDNVIKISWSAAGVNSPAQPIGGNLKSYGILLDDASQTVIPKYKRVLQINRLSGTSDPDASFKDSWNKLTYFRPQDSSSPTFQTLFTMAPPTSATTNNLLKVTSTTTWTSAGQPQTLTTTTYLSYWLEGVL